METFPVGHENRLNDRGPSTSKSSICQVGGDYRVLTKNFIYLSLQSLEQLRRYLPKILGFYGSGEQFHSGRERLWGGMDRTRYAEDRIKRRRSPSLVRSGPNFTFYFCPRSYPEFMVRRGLGPRPGPGGWRVVSETLNAGLSFSKSLNWVTN